ncbi:MAG: PAS domain S-box protein [Arcobacter sp.]|jgi:PAS domain S-box-containing protein|uniref:PAS domain-containing protein n=1 Tax=Arcobacter sp. TaxID=1872629 RepID=UPI002A7619CC|nr:PAS domain S-box protein [Arcobacter sp.]MDY3199829.1 PAS domain S-box protein [Arcobacter sp.]
MKNSFNLKISFLVGVLTFIVALMVGFYSNYISTQQLEVNSGESLLKLSKRVNDILDREMLERFREIRFAASLPIMTDENSSINEKRELIQKIKDNYNHHEWIGYALLDGTVEVGTNGYLEGKNVKARPWHPNGLNGPYIGDVHDALLLAKLLPNNSGEAIYFSDVAFPVINKNGKTLGVLCTHLTWQWTRDVIRSIQKEHGVEIFLLSKDGLILVGPENTERSNISDISLNVAQLLKTDEESFKILNWNNNVKYLTASSVSKGFEEYKGFSWKVIVRQPVDEAFKIAHKNTSLILLISVFLGILGAIIGIIISNKISKPLNKLNQIVDDITNNKEVKFLKNVSNDEIGKLHNALENLYKNLIEESKDKKNAQIKVELSLKIFEQALEGIIICDKNNNIILVNRAFTQITGYELNDIYGKNPSILNSGLQNQEFYENMWNRLRKDGKWDGHLKNKRKDGTIYDEYLKISTLKDRKDEIVNYLATFNSGF